MTVNLEKYDVIIIGGSYAGLAAAMSLGRAARRALVIDAGKPCNRSAPHAHNFLTQDGRPPQEIAVCAKEQVARYDTISFYIGRAVSGKKRGNGFEIRTESGERFTAAKLILASGLKDIMPDFAGFAECWGISIIHCPYCHGYEVRNRKTGIFCNGDAAFHYARLISNWTDDLRLFTDGKCTMTPAQTAKLGANRIEIIETEIVGIARDGSQVTAVLLKDESEVPVDAIYMNPTHIQRSDIPESLGCEMTEEGLIKVDDVQRSSVHGVYAAGDNSGLRTIAAAVASGSVAGSFANSDLIADEF